MLYKTGSLADFFHNSRKALVNARDDKNIYSLIVEYNMMAERMIISPLQILLDIKIPREVIIFCKTG